MSDYFNHNILSKIDSDKKAYILGWLLTGKFNNENKSIIIKTKKENYDCLNLIKMSISNKFNIKMYDTEISILIKSKRLYTCVVRDHVIDEEFKLYYYRGLIEGSGNFNITKSYPQYEIKLEQSMFDINKIIDLGFKYEKIDTKLVFSNTNCIDLFGYIYNNNNKITNNTLLLSSTYKQFIHYTDWRFCQQRECIVYKTDDNAVIPSKANYSDVGYDITIIKIDKVLNSKTTRYDTGINVNVPFGYYLEVIPRSSLSKSGYVLSNSPGTVEKSYTGNILIALTKVVDDAEDIKLPFTCCQIKFTPQVYIDLVYDSNKNEEETNRGSGGFGSTNEKTTGETADEVVNKVVETIEVVNEVVETIEVEQIDDDSIIFDKIDQNIINDLIKKNKED